VLGPPRSGVVATCEADVTADGREMASDWRRRPGEGSVEKKELPPAALLVLVGDMRLGLFGGVSDLRRLKSGDDGILGRDFDYDRNAGVQGGTWQLT
jgi:hypothetical protein